MHLCLHSLRVAFSILSPASASRLLSAAPRVVLGLLVPYGSYSVTIGLNWRHSLWVPFWPQPHHHMRISLLIVGAFSWCVWFICLLLLILTHSHILHAVGRHLPHGIPGTCRIWCLAHGSPGDCDVSGPNDGSPVYRVWDASIFCVCIAHLDSRKAFDGYIHAWFPEFDQWPWRTSLSSVYSINPRVS